jgi:Sec23/Sec24 trunk domain
LVSLVIDATLDEDLLEEVVEACKVLLYRLPPSTLVSLIAFDSAVTLFELANLSTELPGPAQSWVLPGDAQATPAMLQRLCASASALLAPVGTCIHAACAALDTLRPLHNTLKSRARPRCIGAALVATLGVYSAIPSGCLPGHS